jgi:hypothetical protein
MISNSSLIVSNLYKISINSRSKIFCYQLTSKINLCYNSSDAVARNSPCLKIPEPNYTKEFDCTYWYFSWFYPAPPHKCRIEKAKDLPSTGRGGPLGCEASRFPHSVDSWLTDGGEVVRLTG